MKKIALVFLLAVFVPSLLLAWLGVRSLHDQQFALERQQSLLYQGVADSLVKEVNDVIAYRQRDFNMQVESLLSPKMPPDITATFDKRLRAAWPAADVGFVVTDSGRLACPSPYDGEAAKTFYTENGKFVCNIQSAEVYWTPKMAYNNINSKNSGQSQQLRNVTPQQQFMPNEPQQQAANISKAAPTEAEFRQLVGDSSEGVVSRFLENKLNILMWHRSPAEPGVIFGAQLSVAKIKLDLGPVASHLEPALRNDIAVAILDENARPVTLSKLDFQANWKRPFVSTELGEALPHWEMAVYLLNPAKAADAAHAVRLTIGLLIVVLLLAIGVGGWLIVADMTRQLALARQKTDFVSNVSHELKTPLTSIRMFAELLAEGRVTDPAKSRSYLNIISAEASRLTRLINNVLDFSRLERGEKKYNFQECDLSALLRETVQTYRPHLEEGGFRFDAQLPEQPAPIRGDRDALAQVIVNLLSNAEKYSNGHKEISLELESIREPLPHVDVRVLDRGSGVPPGCAEKIFEQFYRAHDSLSSGIQGSGLGLTLARQIARAHGGDVLYRQRDGGGSCFTLRLPLENK